MRYGERIGFPSSSGKLPSFLEGEVLRVYRELTDDDKKSAKFKRNKGSVHPVDACGKFLRDYDKCVWRKDEAHRNCRGC